MFKFAEFTDDKDGTPVVISANHVVYIRMSGSGTNIALAYKNKNGTGLSVTVRESYEHVRQALGFHPSPIGTAVRA